MAPRRVGGSAPLTPVAVGGGASADRPERSRTRGGTAAARKNDDRTECAPGGVAGDGRGVEAGIRAARSRGDGTFAGFAPNRFGSGGRASANRTRAARYAGSGADALAAWS